MSLLIFYAVAAIFFSFLCSILEAVLLSISPTFINIKNLTKLTANCEELSNKIEKKSNGYKIGFMTSISEKIEIITKIAEEYQNCN